MQDNSHDEDFRDVFTKFYLSSQGDMWKDENRIPFFDKLHCCERNQDFVGLWKSCMTFWR